MTTLYGHKFIKESSEVDEELKDVDLKEYVSLIAYDDISRGSDEQIKEFCESELAKVLCEKQVFNKPEMMRISKQTDLKRRTKLIAYQLAKEANDVAWRKMVKYRALMKEQRDIIMKKYGKKAQKIALASQKEYIKTARKASSTPKADEETK